jgi:hypothetical protein
MEGRAVDGRRGCRWREGLRTEGGSQRARKATDAHIHGHLNQLLRQQKCQRGGVALRVHLLGLPRHRRCHRLDSHPPLEHVPPAAAAAVALAALLPVQRESRRGRHQGEVLEDRLQDGGDAAGKTAVPGVGEFEGKGIRREAG